MINNSYPYFKKKEKLKQMNSVEGHAHEGAHTAGSLKVGNKHPHL